MKKRFFACIVCIVCGLFLVLLLVGMKYDLYSHDVHHGSFDSPSDYDSLAIEFADFLEVYDCVNSAVVQIDNKNVHVSLVLNESTNFYPTIAEQMERFAYYFFPNCETVDFSFT